MQNHEPRRFGRTMACATIATLVLTVASPLAMAGPSQGPKEASTIAASTDTAGLIAVRHYRQHYRNGGSAAGLAAMGMAIGTIGAIATQQRRSDYYDNGYNNGYYNNGYGYQSAPRYYGNGPYYGGGYYGR
jgi:hypothetical protein